MRRKPIEVKHICGHSTFFYRYDPTFITWTELAKQRTCGNMACRAITDKSKE